MIAIVKASFSSMPVQADQCTDGCDMPTDQKHAWVMTTPIGAEQASVSG
jgi:hypothetical protein